MNKVVDRPPIYRIIFTQLEALQEIYAQYLSEETLMGFIEADTLLEFDPSQQIINPKEVRRCYIPLHNIVRIDEISVHNTNEVRDNISHLPHALRKSQEQKNS